MKTSTRILSHLTLGILAFILVKNIAQKPNNSDSNKTPNAQEKSTTSSNNKERAKRKFTKEEFQQAWNDIPSRKLNLTDRITLQRSLLSRWAEVDAEAALQAFFSSRLGVSGMGGDESSSLLAEIFSATLVDRQDEMWKLIKSRKLGILESSTLGKAWTTAIAQKDPLLLYSYFKEMDGNSVTACLIEFSQSKQSKPHIAELLKQLGEKEKSGAPVTLSLEKTALYLESTYTEEELHKMLDGTSGSIQSLYVHTLAHKHVEALRTNTVENPSATGDILHLEKIPAANQHAYVEALLNSTSGTVDLYKQSLEYLVAHEKWDSLAQKNKENVVRRMAANGNPQELAQWCYSLPARPETTEIFHRGIETYIKKSPEQSMEWIQTMQNTYWRDRALAEYSQQSLHHFNDPAQSRIAIDQISDPTYRNTVESWRKSWEEKK